MNNDYVCDCIWCGRPIYQYDAYYRMDEETIFCEDCIDGVDVDKYAEPT